MKSWVRIVICSLMVVCSTFGEWEMILDGRPGAITFGSSENFQAMGPASVGERRVELYEKTQNASLFPSLKLGVGREGMTDYIEILGTVGVWLNDPFQSPFLGVDAAWSYRFRKNLALGPHVAFLYFLSPSWQGAGDFDISSSWGTMGGCQVALGYDLQFMLSLDYVYLQPFDITARGGWETDSDTLDFSGIAIQFGVRGRF